MRARQDIISTFPDARFTPMLTTPAEPDDRSNTLYSNLLATFTTDADEPLLVARLKDLELTLGNTAALRRQGIVMMDLDILQYAGERRHHDDWQRSYVKKLIKTLLTLIIIFIFQFSIFNPLQALAAGRGEQDRELLGKAIEYYQGRKYHESILAFEQLRRHYQLNPRFLAYLGFSYYKEAQYEEAAACLEESIPQLTAYSPHEQAVYLYACAESHFNLSHYQQALPYYQQALPLTTGLDAADINYHMAFCYYLDDTLCYETQSENAAITDTVPAIRQGLISSSPVNLFLTANRLYQEAAALSPLSPLHAARLSQTTKMLRALIKEGE